MNIQIKRFIGIILIISCLLVISGCNNATPTPSSEVTDTATPTPTPSDDNDATPTPSASDEPTPTPTPSDEPLNRPTGIPEKTVETVTPPVVEQPALASNGYVNLGGINGIGGIIECCSIQSEFKWDSDTAGDCENYKPLNLFWGVGYKLRSFESAGIPFAVTFAPQYQIKIAYYSFTVDMSDDPNGNDRPTSWKLYGANTTNYSDAVLIDERENIVLPMTTGEESELFEITNKEYYQFYKIVFTKTAGNTNVVQLDEINLYGIDGDCIGGYNKAESSDISNYTILNGLIKEKLIMATPLSQGGAEWGKAKSIFDCDITTYFHQLFQYSKDVDHLEVVFVFSKATPFDAYRFTLYDMTGAPVTWELIGSNSSSFDTYDVLDSRENVSMPGYNHAETQVFECQKVGNYKYYMLKIYDCTFGNDENWMYPELAEMTLLQKNE